MPPEDVAPGSPRDWLRIARSDLALTSAPLPSGVLLESLCFHAQQAAEKSLKGLLVSRHVAIPRTHSLRLLIDLIGACISVPAEIEEAALYCDRALSGRF